MSAEISRMCTINIESVIISYYKEVLAHTNGHCEVAVINVYINLQHVSSEIVTLMHTQLYKQLYNLYIDAENYPIYTWRFLKYCLM